MSAPGSLVAPHPPRKDGGGASRSSSSRTGAGTTYVVVVPSPALRGRSREGGGMGCSSTGMRKVPVELGARRVEQ